MRLFWGGTHHVDLRDGPHAAHHHVHLHYCRRTWGQISTCLVNHCRTQLLGIYMLLIYMMRVGTAFTKNYQRNKRNIILYLMLRGI